MEISVNSIKEHVEKEKMSKETVEIILWMVARITELEDIIYKLEPK